MENGMDPGIDIRRRKDGSIDVEHYLRIARAERRAALRGGTWAIVTALGRLPGRICGAFAVVRSAVLRSQKA